MRRFLVVFFLSALSFAQTSLTGGTITGMRAGAAPSALVIITTTLPNGQNGFVYTQTIQTTGGVGTVSCSMVSGALPAGLAFTGCTLSGIPTQSGNFTFGVQASDQSNPVQLSPVQQL